MKEKSEQRTKKNLNKEQEENRATFKLPCFSSCSH